MTTWQHRLAFKGESGAVYLATVREGGNRSSQKIIVPETRGNLARCRHFAETDFMHEPFRKSGGEKRMMKGLEGMEYPLRINGDYAQWN